MTHIFLFRYITRERFLVRWQQLRLPPDRYQAFAAVGGWCDHEPLRLKRER
jgi:hypothetical protein